MFGAGKLPLPMFLDGENYRFAFREPLTKSNHCNQISSTVSSPKKFFNSCFLCSQLLASLVQILLGVNC